MFSGHNDDRDVHDVHDHGHNDDPDDHDHGHNDDHDHET